MRRRKQTIVGQFVPLPRELLQSDAWRSLGINERRLIDYLLLEHMSKGGQKNGELMAPRRQLVAFGIHANSVSAAIAEVQRLGLVDCRRGRGRRPNVFSITWLPMVDDAEPSNRWRIYQGSSHHNGCRTALNSPDVMSTERLQQ